MQSSIRLHTTAQFPSSVTCKSCGHSFFFISRLYTNSDVRTKKKLPFHVSVCLCPLAPHLTQQLSNVEEQAASTVTSKDILRSHHTQQTYGSQVETNTQFWGCPIYDKKSLSLCAVSQNVGSLVVGQVATPWLQ